MFLVKISIDVQKFNSVMRRYEDIYVCVFTATSHNPIPPLYAHNDDLLPPHLSIPVPHKNNNLSPLLKCNYL